MISDFHKFIFFHVPKAAGSSIISFFKDHYPDKAVINSQNPDLLKFLNNRMTFPNHAPCRLIREFLGIEKYNMYYKFAFVRNPFDKLVSLFFYTKQTEVELAKTKPEILNDFNRRIINSDSIDEWVSSKRLGDTQWSFLSVENKLAVDFVGKTESIEDDFAGICKRLNITEKFVQRSNTSSHQNYRNYFSLESRRIVEDYFKDDLEKFGYSF